MADSDTITKIPKTTNITFVQVTNFYYIPEEKNAVADENEKDKTENELTTTEKVSEDSPRKLGLYKSDDIIDDKDSVKTENEKAECVADETTDKSSPDECYENDVIDTKETEEAIDIEDKLSNENKHDSQSINNEKEQNTVDNKQTLAKKEKKNEKRGKKLKKSKSFVNQFRQCLPMKQR